MMFSTVCPTQKYIILMITRSAVFFAKTGVIVRYSEERTMALVQQVVDP